MIGDAWPSLGAGPVMRQKVFGNEIFLHEIENRKTYYCFASKNASPIFFKILIQI